jgi:hypothetical protein
MRKFRLLSLLFLATTFITVSCTKEGPEGPAGANGAQGPAGATGAAGAQGPVGPGATYSAWYTTTAADWVALPDPNQYTGIFKVDRAAPAITQSIIDNGVILGYISAWRVFGFPRAPETAQMPNWADFNFVDYYDYVVPSAGNISYLYKSFDPWDAANLAGTKYRYIAIPGTVAGGRNTTPTYGGFTAAELKAMPYEKVASLFHIPAEGTNIK